MTNQHETVKVTSKLVLPVGVWTTVVKHDWPTTLTQAQAMGLGADDVIGTTFVDAQLYINVAGSLTSTSRCCGEYDVRGVRLDVFNKTGVVDETAVADYRLGRRGTGVTGGGFKTHRWEGKNPGGFLWQVMPRSGCGIASMYVTTRQGKVQTR